MEKKFDDIFLSIDQVGIVAPDEESAGLAANMKDVFDLTDEQAVDGGVFRHLNSTYMGEPNEPGPGVHMYLFNKFNIQLEYLCPVDGKSAWMDYRNKVGKGIHHIRFDVASHDEAIAYMAAKGIKTYQTADSVKGEGLKFAYFDSYDKLGFYIETFNMTEVARKKEREM